MSSSRLPGKVLLPLAGREVLFHVWERLSVVGNIDKIVIATTDRESDQPIVKYCEEHGIEVFAYAGPEEDLLGRYIACAKHHQADIVVMVCSDCPLLHPPSIERMTQALLDNPDAEHCYLEPESIEGGVAVLRLSTYEKMEKLGTEDTHREYATLFLMENPELFSNVAVPSDTELQGIKHRLWLDTPADYAFLNEVYERLYQPGKMVDLHKVVHMLRTDRQLREMNEHVVQKNVRAKQHKLCVRLVEIDQALEPVALAFCASLIERYHLGLRILSDGMKASEKQIWHSRMFSLSDRPIKKGETLITLCSGGEGVVPEVPGEQGEPRIRIGLDSHRQTEQLVELMACYLGQDIGIHGYFVPRQLSVEKNQPLETVVCPLCGSEERDQVWTHTTGIMNARCCSCDHVYLAVRPSSVVIDASYDEFKQNYGERYLLDESCDLLKLAQSRFAVVQQYQKKPPGSVLEIGSAYGHFLSRFDQGCTRVGIEPSREQTLFARKHYGLANVWECNYKCLESNAPNWPQAGFDLISSFHVMEHVEQPIHFLQFIKKNLRVGGYLYIAVPNLLTLPTDLIELYFICRGLHLHTFSPARLEAFLTEQGFEVLEVKEEQKTPMSPSSTLVVAKSVIKPPKRNLLKKESIEINEALVNYHQVLDEKLYRVRAAFQKWHETGCRIVVYGAGTHTRALLNLVGISPEWISAIIDDDPAKQQSFLHGIPIDTFDAVLNQLPDVIVVSSLASENIILSRLQGVVANTTELCGIYRDLMMNE
jgi:spore coat polysaccharide biosynthesis protein SpsF